MWYFIAGLIVGAPVGAIIMAVIAAGKNYDNQG